MDRTTGTVRQLRVFALTLSGVLLLLSFVCFRRGTATSIPALLLTIAGALLMSGWVFPGQLAPVHRKWMRFAEAIGWVNTRILLGIVFYAVLTPMGLLMRILRVDPMERTRTGTSYWKKSDPRTDNHFEKRF